MIRVALAAVVLALVFPAAAAADLRVLLDGAPSPALQGWVDASEVPVAGGLLQAFSGPCVDGRLNPCTTTPGDRVWLSSAVVPLAQKRLVFSHELGHRFDYRVMTPAARDAFRALIGTRRPWRAAPNSPHEQFAEAYGLCLRHRVIARDRDAGNYGYWPTRGTHRRVCRLIRMTAAAAPGAAA